MLTSRLYAYISRYGDFCANDNNNNDDDSTDYFTPCACARGNNNLGGGGCGLKNTCRQVIKNLIGVALQFVWAFNEREKGAGVHSFFPVLVKVRRAIVWGYALSCLLVNWERRVTLFLSSNR